MRAKIDHLTPIGSAAVDQNARNQSECPILPDPRVGKQSITGNGRVQEGVSGRCMQSSQGSGCMLCEKAVLLSLWTSLATYLHPQVLGRQKKIIVSGL